MKKVIYTSIVVLLCVLFFNQCRQTAQLKNSLKNEIEVKQDSINYYKNALNLEVAEKQAYKTSSVKNSVAFNALKKENKQFKEASKKWRKLYSALKIDVEFKVDSVDIPFNKPVNYEFSRKFIKETELYTFSGVVNQYGINISSLATATITPFTGEKKTGLFNSEFRTEITTNNDLVTVRNFDSFTFQPEKKRFGFGFFMGPAITTNLKPTLAVGFGVSYDLFSF